MKTSSKLSEILDNYFNRMDNAQIIPNGIFQSENDKERYETQLMFAFRKYQAAVYHYENVKKFIEGEDIMIKNAKSLEIEELKNINVTGFQFVCFPVDHYVYELSAFLTALKSSIDFLCKICEYHLSGIKMDSIKTLIRLVEKGNSGPIIDEVRNNIAWLKKIRSYRDHLVHRLILPVVGGHETHFIGDFTKNIRYPIVIPESSPSYIPDTRMKRMMEEKPSNLDYYCSNTRIINDGREEVVKFDKKISPSHGYIPIEDFMESHLNSFEEFFRQIIQALINLNFTIHSVK